jgi:hypothetical protein
MSTYTEKKKEKKDTIVLRMLYEFSYVVFSF